MSLIKNLVKEPPKKKDAKDGEEDEPKIRSFIKSATDVQRIRLEKLMKNPDKPVIIPEQRKDKDYMQAVPSFVRNVMGSSAGAGSGEFHVYRHLRRKEYARQKTIKAKSIQEQLDDDYQQKLEDNRRKAEEKTAKKRAKRLKRKQQRAKRPKQQNANDSDEQQQNEATSDEDEDNNDDDKEAVTTTAANNDDVEDKIASSEGQVNKKPAETVDAEQEVQKVAHQDDVADNEDAIVQKNTVKKIGNLNKPEAMDEAKTKADVEEKTEAVVEEKTEAALEEKTEAVVEEKTEAALEEKTASE